MRRPARVRNLIVNTSCSVGFSLIELLAALHLHGWLAVGLLLIAAWNMSRLALAGIGVAIIAADALNSDPQRDGCRQR